MTTDDRNRGGESHGTPKQSSSHRIVRIMVVVMLVIVAVAFALYGFAAWSGATINCAPGAETAEACGGSRRAMWILTGLTIATLLGAVFAWRKLDA